MIAVVWEALLTIRVKAVQTDTFWMLMKLQLNLQHKLRQCWGSQRMELSDSRETKISQVFLKHWSLQPNVKTENITQTIGWNLHNCVALGCISMTFWSFTINNVMRRFIHASVMGLHSWCRVCTLQYTAFMCPILHIPYKERFFKVKTHIVAEF